MNNGNYLTIGHFRENYSRLGEIGVNKSIKPFVLQISASQIDDLRSRLSLTRFPSEETVPDTAQGPQLKAMRKLRDYWLHQYDWRKCEQRLNGWGQFTTEIDGLSIHFLHIRSENTDALPLLLTHGWPGSVLEFQKVIDLLTCPEKRGGSAEQAFHLIIPSLPGFGFSEQPILAGWNLDRIADAWIELMGRLGYSRWGAQGGDWGAAVTLTLARKQPRGLVGANVNFVMFQPTADEIKNANVEEHSMVQSMQNYQSMLSGYALVQSTRPQAVSFALSDSPMGQAAWIYSLFEDVADCDGKPENVFSLDEILDDIMLYWLPNASGSSARIYWEAAASMMVGPTAFFPMKLPVGISVFPKEQVRISRRWAESRFKNLVFYKQFSAGGHFAALERPSDFVEGIRETFTSLRG